MVYIKIFWNNFLLKKNVSNGSQSITNYDPSSDFWIKYDEIINQDDMNESATIKYI